MYSCKDADIIAKKRLRNVFLMGSQNLDVDKLDNPKKHHNSSNYQ